MPMINFTNPLTLLLATLVFVLVLILAKETKKSFIAAIMLFVFVGLLVTNAIIFTTSSGLTQSATSDFIFTMVFDLIFVLISFISYLWVDDIEAKVKKKRNIDNSLDWFWGKIWGNI